MEHGTRLQHVPRVPSDDVLVNPDGYPGYFTRLQDEGARFVRATPEQREKATVLAPMAAVIAPGIADEERILFTDGWFEVPYLIARQVIQDFLDPEALLL